MAPSLNVAEPPSTLPVKDSNKSDVEALVRANEQTELTIAAEMGAPDVYIDNQNDTLWYHWVGSIYVKILRLENRTGTYVIKLKTDPHAELGKHRHRGMVKAYTCRGNWGYHECVGLDLRLCPFPHKIKIPC